MKNFKAMLSESGIASKEDLKVAKNLQDVSKKLSSIAKSIPNSKKLEEAIKIIEDVVYDLAYPK